MTKLVHKPHMVRPESQKQEPVEDKKVKLVSCRQASLVPCQAQNTAQICSVSPSLGKDSIGLSRELN